MLNSLIALDGSEAFERALGLGLDQGGGARALRGVDRAAPRAIEPG